MKVSRGIEAVVEEGIEEMVLDGYRYRGGVKPACKSNFSRGEKHRHECNQVCNSTNDPNNILSSQKQLSEAILST